MSEAKTIGPCTKEELRHMYAINGTPISSGTLRNWLREIEDELKKVGYNKDKKIITIPQLEIIFKHFGRP